MLDAMDGSRPNAGSSRPCESSGGGSDGTRCMRQEYDGDDARNGCKVNEETMDEYDFADADYANERQLARTNAQAQSLYFPASSISASGNGVSKMSEHALIQSKLNQRLGPEYVAQRDGPGGRGGPKLSYLEGWKAIELMNEMFGFNGWSSTVQKLEVDYCDETRDGRFNIGVTAIVRVTLRDGTFHEDVGFGMIDNAKAKGQGLEKTKKEAVTDATKRAMRLYGSAVGNCVYDKEYTNFVAKTKKTPAKFDISTLKRGPEGVVVLPRTDDRNIQNGSDQRTSPLVNVRQPSVSSATGRASVVVSRPDVSKAEGLKVVHPSNIRSPSSASSACSEATPKNRETVQVAQQQPKKANQDVIDEKLRQAKARFAANAHRRGHRRAMNEEHADHVEMVDDAIRGELRDVKTIAEKKTDVLASQDEFEFDSLADVTPSQLNSLSALEATHVDIKHVRTMSHQSVSGKRAEYVPLHEYLPEMSAKRTRY